MKNIIKDEERAIDYKANLSIEYSNRVNIFNRKYIGSKFRLLNFIEKVILSNSPRINIFFDGFAGTGCVAHHFKKFSKKIIANDNLFSNYVILKTFLNSTKRNVNIEKLEHYIEQFNNHKPIKGYAYANYGSSYFTKYNAGKIDYARETIEEYVTNNKITEQEKYILITSLLFAIDKVANTCGQYDAFLKHIGKDSYNKEGKHLIDSNVYKMLSLRMPRVEFDGSNVVFCKDLNELVKKLDVEVDVLYLDPPYNTRQYCDNYHVLENIAKWIKPILHGKTKKFDRKDIKSKYSSKLTALSIFRDLISNCKAKHIYLSYNSEGIMPYKDIIEILSARGKVRVHEQPYSIFGNGAGVSKKRPIMERLFHCKVDL